MGEFYACLEKVQEKHIAKWHRKIKKQVLPVGVSKDNLENLSYLFPSSCFLSFFLSGLNSSPPHTSLFPTVALAHPHTCLLLCQYIFRLLSYRLLPHSPFSACHSVTLLLSLFPLLPGFPPFTSATSSPALPRLSVSALQRTSVTRRCSCARMAGRAFRTRSASVLRSLRGCCANNPAARRARTATLPLPCAPPHC